MNVFPRHCVAERKQSNAFRGLASPAAFLRHNSPLTKGQALSRDTRLPACSAVRREPVHFVSKLVAHVVDVRICHTSRPRPHILNRCTMIDCGDYCGMRFPFDGAQFALSPQRGPHDEGHNSRATIAKCAIVLGCCYAIKSSCWSISDSLRSLISDFSCIYTWFRRRVVNGCVRPARVSRR